ncbi:MAG: ribokinase [Synergistaceae bacterium]|jgi:ribokinase|nr:ribokinase [Synergistaceae bacterium]
MKKILNIGSINIDYVYGVRHFVRPGETISSVSLNVFPGGKGLNQSVALSRAGGSVYHAGKTGPDGGGMIEVMRDAGVDVSLVETTGSATGHAIIQVNSSGENCIILHPGANHELDDAFVGRAMDAFGEGDFIVLQNEVNDMPHILKSARSRRLRIVFNLAPFGPEIKDYPLELVDYFLVNETEGRELSGKSAPEDILGEMMAMFPSSAVLLTIGRDGALYRDAGTTITRGIYEVPVVDTTAAGDTFTGYFVSSVADGIPVSEALRRASVASSIAVSRKGASSSVPTLSETLAADLKYLPPR